MGSNFLYALMLFLMNAFSLFETTSSVKKKKTSRVMKNLWVTVCDLPYFLQSILLTNGVTLFIEVD